MLLFLGDVYLPWTVKCNFHIETPYIFNLEGPITSQNQATCGKINLKMVSSLFTEVFGCNPIAVCLANNHIMDYDKEGLSDTLTNLKAHGIKFFGAGTLAENCHNPLILEIDGFRVALLGYVCFSTHAIFVTNSTPGVRPIEKSVINDDIQTAKKAGAQRIIVHLHWGTELVSLPKWEDIQTAEDIIAMGADLIIGHHAHCIQPYQVWQRKHVYYGLGNCVFPLDRVPSNCQPDGDFKTFLVGKRGKQKSLAVQYDLATSSCRTFQLAFSNNTLYWQHEKQGSWSPSGSRECYATQYRKAERMAIFHSLISSFLNRPRFPRISSVRKGLSRANSH